MIIYCQQKKINRPCIKRCKTDIMIVSASRDAVDNRGEDLRFPISSSSGFSSPMKGHPQGCPKQSHREALCDAVFLCLWGVRSACDIYDLSTKFSNQVSYQERKEGLCILFTVRYDDIIKRSSSFLSTLSKIWPCNLHHLGVRVAYALRNCLRMHLLVDPKTIYNWENDITYSSIDSQHVHEKIMVLRWR